MVEVAVVRTGVANLASVVAAFERLGADTIVTTDEYYVRDATHVMLPGVGAFGAGMAALSEARLVDVLKRRIEADRPTIAICLGLQLLCEVSEETPGVAGIGVVPAEVTRFPSDALKVPQLGWNKVVAPDDARFSRSGHAYFANSYRIVQSSRAYLRASAPTDDALVGWSVTEADYGGPFVAAIERGNVLACQFHPELSGLWGAAVLGRWLEMT